MKQSRIELECVHRFPPVLAGAVACQRAKAAPVSLYPITYIVDAPYHAAYSADRKALATSVTEDIRQQAKTELRRARMLIDGAWVDSMSGRVLPVENPAKRRPIAEIPRGDTADVNGAVEAAARASPAWSKVAPRDRGRLLLRIADKMEAEAEEMARIIALETGNALRTQARGEARLPPPLFPLFLRP